MSDAAAEARKRARGSWPIRRFALGEEPSDNLRSSTTAQERLAMMWELAVTAWRIAGRPLPDYTRGDTPGRVLRPSDRADP